MKLKIILFAISFFSIVAECGEALAASYTVCASGCNYTTIQAAVNACTTGTANTITVQNTYSTTNEDVTVNKSGQNASNRLIIRATGATKTIHSFTSNGSYITFDGFTVDGTSNSRAWSGLVEISGNTDIIVQNNTIINPGVHGYGMRVYQSGSISNPSYVTIQNNRISYQSGTAEWPAAQLVLSGSNSLVVGNLFTDTKRADTIDLFGSNHIIRGNEITENVFVAGNPDHPDVFQGWGISDQVSYGHLIENNFVHDIGSVAIGQLEQNCGVGGCTSVHSGTFTSVGTTTATDRSKSWAVNQMATKYVLMIYSGTAQSNVYLVSSNTNNVLTVTDMSGNAVNLATDGVQAGDSYRLYMRVGWWTFRNNIFLNLNTVDGSTSGGNWSSYAPYMKFYNNTFYRCNVVGSPHANPVEFFYAADFGLPWHGEAYNNIFLKNYLGGSTNGWISWTAGFEPAHDYNYVGGNGYIAKTGFVEPHGINGGNPMLVNEGGASAADYRLQPTSFLKDTGKTIDGFSTDYAGNHRPSGAWDIGAYEYVAGNVVKPAAPAGLTVR